MFTAPSGDPGTVRLRPISTPPPLISSDAPAAKPKLLDQVRDAIGCGT